MVSLYCTNQKGRELIANVQIVSLDASNYIDTLSKIEVLLISDYTKDPLIIEQEPNVHLLPATDIDLKAITKFEEYLHGRKKAGVVRIDERNRLYILPSGEAKLRCILFEKVIPSSNRMPSSSAPKETHNPASNLQVEDAEEDSKAPTTQGTQAEAIKHAKEVEDKLHNDLAIFETDPSFNSLHLPPMDHKDRYLVDEVVFSDYPSLVSTSIGDGDERHIVVYRKGHQPKDVPFEATLVGETIIKNTSSGPKIKKPDDSKSNHGKIVAPPSFHNLVAVNTVKRDRRTDEEILQDIKRKKSEGNSVEDQIEI